MSRVPGREPGTLETFHARVDRSGGPGSCWPWTGPKNAEGYGAAFYEGQAWPAHRLAWFLENGPIPVGRHICHTCDNRPCCNPAHLYPGTPADNVHDCMRRGRARHNHGLKFGPNVRHTTGHELRMRRMFIGLTQVAVAAELGISRIAVNAIEGKIAVRDQRAAEYREALERLCPGAATAYEVKMAEVRAFEERMAPLLASVNQPPD